MNATVTAETLGFLKRKFGEASEAVKELRQQQEDLSQRLKEAEKGLATWQDAYERACRESGALPETDRSEQASATSQNGFFHSLVTNLKAKKVRPNSIPSLALEILGKAGHPMQTAEIKRTLESMGKQAEMTSIDSMLLRYRDIFKRQPDNRWWLVGVTTTIT